MFLLIEALNHMRKFPRKTQVKLQVYWILWGVPNEKRPKSIDLYYNAVSGKGTASDKLYLLADSDNHILYVIESFY